MIKNTRNSVKEGYFVFFNLWLLVLADSFLDANTGLAMTFSPGYGPDFTSFPATNYSRKKRFKFLF